jgi:uncharacterized RDD family membrane protein YckC
MRFRKLKQHQKQPKTDMQEEKKRFLYAPHVLKIKAFITDMFMMYAPILYILAYIVLDGKDDFVNSQLAPLIGVGLYGLIHALLIAKFAQTPGKKAYSLRVLDATTGKNISILRALLRFVAFLFSATILIGLLFPFYRKDKKGLHDLIAHTVEVVEKESL